MRITSKGQVTIPIHIREQFGFLPHTHIEFVVDGDNVIVRKIHDHPQDRGRWIVEHLTGRGTGKLTTDEIMALTRGED